MKGAELLEIRKRLGLTQSEIAELVGVTRNSIARQERGEIGIREPLAILIRMAGEGKLRPKRSPVGRRRKE